MNLIIVRLSGDAPLQAFGYLDGKPWYFRARGERWEFGLAARTEFSFEEAVRATAEIGPGLLISKRYADTTALTHDKARAIIRRAARAARAFLD